MSGLTYQSAWEAISARIHGMERAATIHAAFLQAKNASPYGADKDLQVHCVEIRKDICTFRENFESVLPQEVIAAIARFMAGGGAQIEQNAPGDPVLLRTILVKLIAFDAEVSYHLNDPLEQVRSASERAFQHLQRLIVVDADCRKKWETAFGLHERQCEKLGGVHLLWHGILAFKVDADGGRTDLVYQEPLVSSAIAASQGLVLTEWKIDKGSPDKAFAEAKKQTQSYSSGVLSGVELTTYRYLVVVTKKKIETPADTTEGGIIYRHVNIAVSPDSPSVDARRRVSP